MEKFNVPEKYRDDFQKALDKAVELGSFSDATLAQELNISRLNAAILIGFMDKFEFLFPSPKNEVKSVRLTAEEWDAIGRDIGKYVPASLDDKEVEFLLTPQAPITALYNKTIEVTAEGIMISDSKTSMFIPAEEVTLPHYRKGGFFRRGFIYFGEFCPKNAREASKSFGALLFRKKLNLVFEAFINNLIGDIERKL